MFERGKWIGQSVLLALLLSFVAAWQFGDASAQQIPVQVAQSAPQAQTPPGASGQPANPGAAIQHQTTNGLIWSDICAGFAWIGTLWPNDASIIGGTIAAFVAWRIANFYTGRVKQIEATLEFSKGFHELI